MRISVLFSGRFVWLGLLVWLCGSAGHCQEAGRIPAATQDLPGAGDTKAIANGQQAIPQEPGSVSGKVVDQSGAKVVGARVKLTREGEATVFETTCDEDGLFAYSNVVPGAFRLTVSSPGLATQEFSGTLSSGEHLVTPVIILAVAKQVTEVVVGITTEELATEQIKEQEKQRVLGVIPNFYVSYVPNAAPLRPKHKFELAWKSTTDPITFVAVGAVAGLDQAGDRWGAYGQGAEGYAKRFGATYADVAVGTFLGGAVFPTILKQDPRYFYRGKGSTKSRFLYALASSVICKGDNGRWQPNYSSIGGNLAAGGIANLYYPANDRHGLGLVVSTAVLRLGEMAVANVFQEFLVPKLTPNLPTRAPTQP
jgi:hypothetical protein